MSDRIFFILLAVAFTVFVYIVGGREAAIIAAMLCGYTLGRV